MSSPPSGQTRSSVDAAALAAQALHHMEATGFVEVSATTATYVQIMGALPGLEPGTQIPRADSLVARVLDGAPAFGAGAATEASLADTVEHARLGVSSHVVVPVLTRTGDLAGLIVGLDRATVTIDPESLPLLRAVADGLGSAWPGPGPRPAAPEAVPATDTAPSPEPAETPAAPIPPAMATPEPASPGPLRTVPTPSPGMPAKSPRPGPPPRPGPRPGPPAPGRPVAPRPTQTPLPPPAPGTAHDLRLRRTGAGWVVEGPGTDIRPVGDLISAMVLADLLADDLNPPGRPRRADRELSELDRLRLSVVQLEHALASRVIVEQAIGVLAERHHIKPRDAFERLRRTARGMGRRVHDLAKQVVESVSDPKITLPGELGGRPGPAAGGPPPAGGPAPRPTPPRPAAPTRH